MHLTHPCSTLSLCPMEHKVAHCHWPAAFVSLLHLSSFSRASLLTPGTLLLQGSIVSHPWENHLFASHIGWCLSRPWSLAAAMLLGFFPSRRVRSGRWQVGEVLQKMACCLSRGPGKRRGIRRGWWEMRGNELPWSPVKRLQELLSVPVSTYFTFYGVAPNASPSQLACLISVSHFWKGEKGGKNSGVSGIPYLE